MLVDHLQNGDGEGHQDPEDHEYHLDEGRAGVVFFEEAGDEVDEGGVHEEVDKEKDPGVGGIELVNVDAGDGEYGGYRLEEDIRQVVPQPVGRERGA